MSLTEIKSNFHSLIDKVEDSETLMYFYKVFSESLNNKWEISDKERKQIMEAYEESEDENNLIDFETVKEKHLKWLSK